MRLAVIVLLLAIGVLAVLYFLGFIQVTAEVINMNLGSIVLSTTYTSFAVVTTWLLGVLFAFAGLLGSGFRKGFFWFLFLFFIAAGAAIFYFYVYK